MKVSNNTNKEAAEVQLSRTRKGDKANAAKAAAESSGAGATAGIGDSSAVSISSEAKALSKAKEIARADNVDQAKIDRIKAMIDKGTYKPDFGQVADKMLNEHLLQET